MSGLRRYRILMAFDHYRKGDIIEPTGMLRDRLLRLKFIAPIEDEPATVLASRKQKRMSPNA